eukprot:c18926_g1_i1 orf=72-248(-)
MKCMFLGPILLMLQHGSCVRKDFPYSFSNGGGLMPRIILSQIYQNCLPKDFVVFIKLP